MAKTHITPAYLSQVDAAAYLGVSVRYFRDVVTVEPVYLPSSKGRPLMRFSRADLDAWVTSLRDPKSRKAVAV